MILQNLDYKKYNFRVILLTVSSIEPIVLLFLISLYLVGNKKGEDPTPPPLATPLAKKSSKNARQMFYTKF